MSNEQSARRADDNLMPVVLSRLDSLEKQFERLGEKLDKNLDKGEERFRIYEERLRAIETRLTQTETRILLWGGGSVSLVALAEILVRLLHL